MSYIQTNTPQGQLLSVARALRAEIATLNGELQDLQARNAELQTALDEAHAELRAIQRLQGEGGKS